MNTPLESKSTLQQKFEEFIIFFNYASEEEQERFSKYIDWNDETLLAFEIACKKNKGNLMNTPSELKSTQNEKHGLKIIKRNGVEFALIIKGDSPDGRFSTDDIVDILAVTHSFAKSIFYNEKEAD